jgi:DNA anti-recombination protein RmuC
MAILNVQSVVNILNELARSTQFDIERINGAIDELEHIKDTININDAADADDAIDKVDEIQDYLQYLSAENEPLMDDIKENLSNMIDDLQEWSK